jgi:hypothetical protein
MKFVTCLAFTVAAFGAVGLAAQGRPNFSGTWIGVGPQQEIRELSSRPEAFQGDTSLASHSGFHLRMSFAGPSLRVTRSQLPTLLPTTFRLF